VILYVFWGLERCGKGDVRKGKYGMREKKDEGGIRGV